MTSSSNIVGDVKQGLKLRKVNSKYFSLKWKRDSGESGGHGNNIQTKLKSRELATADASIDGKNTHGFFQGIKKKLSIKNLYKSKRKIIRMDSSPNVLDAGGSQSMTNLNGEHVPLNDERNIVEIQDRIGTIHLNSANNPNAPIQTSKNKPNDEYPTSDNYLNFQPNINNIECAVDDTHEKSQNRRSNGNNESISHADNHVNNIKYCDVDEKSERKNSNEKKYQTNLLQELQKLRKYGWYWGNTSGDVADAALLSEPDGAFLIRDSSDRRHLLTLSFKSAGKLLHTRVEHSGGMFSLCNQGESGRFPSVPELIDHSMNFSKYAVFCYSRPRHPGYPAFPVRLTKPVSRFNRVRSLQYLCRFVIRQNTRWDNIHKLPLPKSLQVYIEEGHY